MRNSSSLKQEFLRKWITGLRKYSSQKKNMSILERKKAIKLSADLAMASTRDKTTRWSQAVIANASRDDDDNNNKVLTEPQQCQKKVVRKNFNNLSLLSSRRIRSRKILRRCRTIIQKRTRRLKSLLPGGELMDDVSLVEETLDYIQSLRAQVEVMKCFVTASELALH